MLLSALLIGLAGGLHCGLMCGPLQAALFKNKKLNRTLAVFHLGRILTYVLIGILFFTLGQGVSYVGMQEAFIYLICAYIFYFYVMPKKWRGITFFQKLETLPFNSFKKALANHPIKSKNMSRFFAGILNGLLPCGLVYMAAANSLLAPNLFYNMLAMVLFGLSTLPWLAGSVILIKLPAHLFKAKFMKLKPILAAAIICLLLIRITDIPFLKHQHQSIQAKKEIPLCGNETINQ